MDAWCSGTLVDVEDSLAPNAIERDLLRLDLLMNSSDEELMSIPSRLPTPSAEHPRNPTSDKSAGDGEKSTALLRKPSSSSPSSSSSRRSIVAFADETMVGPKET